MTVQEAIRKRRSIRRFEDRPVPEEVLSRVVEAARLAPTAKNNQGIRVITVTDSELRAQVGELAGGQAHVAAAPVILVICGTHLDWHMTSGYPGYVLDGMIAGTQMTLAAVEEGLGTCWVARFHEDRVRALLRVPDDYRIVHLLTLGYPARYPRELARVSMEEFRMRETWRA